MLTAVPPLRLADKDRARRLIALVDALYEARCTLLCDSHVPLESLFFADAGQGGVELDSLLAEAVSETEETREYRPNVAVYEETDQAKRRPTDEKAVPTLPLENLSIFSGASPYANMISGCDVNDVHIGEDERFAFKRALSRIHEMTSTRYGAEAQWTPLPVARRKWETAASAASLPPSSRPQPSPISDSSNNVEAEWAMEAAYDGAILSRPNDRPEAPKLKAEHVWGVREDWDAWGRGKS